MRNEVLKVLHNESSTAGVPISFWRHFADNEFIDAAKYPQVITNQFGWSSRLSRRGQRGLG